MLREARGLRRGDLVRMDSTSSLQLLLVVRDEFVRNRQPCVEAILLCCDVSDRGVGERWLVAAAALVIVAARVES